MKRGMQETNPTDQAVRILLTGFLPFDGFRTNTSAIVVRKFTKRMISLPKQYQVRLTKIVLPVRKSAYRILKSQAPVSSYDIILHLGQADFLPFLGLERVSFNQVVNNLRAATKARVFKTSIVRGAPWMLKASLPYYEVWSKIFSERLPVGEPPHAGTHMCNFILYQSLLNARTRKLKQFIGFLHVTTFDKVATTEAIRTLREILQVCSLEVIRQRLRKKNKGQVGK